MTKQKKQTTTRNTEFNGYTDNNNFYASVATMTADTKKGKANIKLLDTTDYVKTTGKSIIEDAYNNRTMINLGYDVIIDYKNDLTLDKDYYIFGSPYKYVLDNRQQYNNCGIDSIMNTLASAGKITIKDQNKTETAFLKEMLKLGLTEDSGVIGKLDTEDGGTEISVYKEIFAHFNIESECYCTDENSYIKAVEKQYADLKQFAYKISQGHGAIVGVCSDILWQSATSESGTISIDHAISVTGVVYDTDNPTENTTPVGFYIHDTGAWMTRFITLEDFKDATLYYFDGDEEGDHYNENLKDKTGAGIFVTITSNPIKTADNNLNATGDKYDNIILGNSGDNIIKGMNGDDTLYGGKGNDTIYGGNGNDTIYGNGGVDDESYIYGDDDNELFNFTGRNKLYGGNGNDTIYGGIQSDYIEGGSGNDTIIGIRGLNAIYGGSGNDTIYGGYDDDRLFGDSGNDEIHGGKGDDTINGGSGNDIIYGDDGNDRIETGSGNDIVCFESTAHGIDTITSSSGRTILQYEDIQDFNIGTDLNFNLERNENNSNYFDFQIGYGEDEYNGIQFQNFFNQKKNSAKYVTIRTVENNEVKDIYRVGATNSTKAKVFNTKGNNILFTTSLKNKTITTSKYDDIVYMMDAKDEEEIRDVTNRRDTITYTGGKDTYISLAGNTTYIVNSFDKNTNLSISDNVEPIKKENNEYVSMQDEIKINTSEDKISFFFDLDSKGNFTENTNLFVLSDDFSSYKELATSNDVINGTIGIEDFFKKDTEDEYGNGYIETFQVKDGKNYVDYDVTSVINQIQSSVATWLTEKNYTSVFDAIQEENDISELIGYYSTARPTT